jgi:hypothetical protein
MAVLLLLCVAGSPPPSHAQVAAYGEFSAGDFTNLQGSTWLTGASTGILVDGPSLWHKRLQLGGDIQGRFLHASNFNFDGITVGPRLYVPAVWSIRPYVEFMTGFARIHNANDYSVPAEVATTDATIQINGGVMKKLTPHLDVIADYSYAQYYAFGGEFNPKTVSAGVAYYFAKR